VSEEPPLAAEQHARVLIDRQLNDAGWVVQDRKTLNRFAGPGVAVRSAGSRRARPARHAVWSTTRLVLPAVGRVVAVSALLENKAQVLAETVASVPQDTLSVATIASLKKFALRAAGQIDSVNAGTGADPVTPAVTDFLSRLTPTRPRLRMARSTDPAEASGIMVRGVLTTVVLDHPHSRSVGSCASRVARSPRGPTGPGDTPVARSRRGP